MAVLADASNLGHGSKLLGRDRLYASASAVTSALEDRKPRKRPSKDERRTMVETYVNEYVFFKLPFVSADKLTSRCCNSSM